MASAAGDPAAGPAANETTTDHVLDRSQFDETVRVVALRIAAAKTRSVERAADPRRRPSAVAAAALGNSFGRERVSALARTSLPSTRPSRSMFMKRMTKKHLLNVPKVRARARACARGATSLSHRVANARRCATSPRFPGKGTTCGCCC